MNTPPAMTIPGALAVAALAIVCGCGTGEQPMPGSDLTCSACRAVIPLEKPYHSLTLAREQRDPDGISVVEAVALVQFCENCSRNRELETGIRVFSRETGRLALLDDMEHVHADNCWDCGSRLGDDPYFSLVHYHEKLSRDMEIEVVEAVDVLYLCVDCRDKYDFQRLGLSQAE